MLVVGMRKWAHAGSPECTWAYVQQCASTLWVGYVCMIVQILVTTETLTDSTQ